MKLNPDQIKSILPRYQTSSGRYNLPMLGLLDREELWEAVNQDVIRFYFEGGRIYIQAVADVEQMASEQGEAQEKLNLAKFNRWLRKVSPPVNQGQEAGLEQRGQQVDFEEFLGDDKHSR